MEPFLAWIEEQVVKWVRLLEQNWTQLWNGQFCLFHGWEQEMGILPVVSVFLSQKETSVKLKCLLLLQVVKYDNCSNIRL